MSDDFDEGPYVCPGCYAVGGERCASWCPDAAIAAARYKELFDDEDGPESLDEYYGDEP